MQRICVASASTLPHETCRARDLPSVIESDRRDNSTFTVGHNTRAQHIYDLLLETKGEKGGYDEDTQKRGTKSEMDSERMMMEGKK